MCRASVPAGRPPRPATTLSASCSIAPKNPHKLRLPVRPQRPACKKLEEREGFVAGHDPGRAVKAAAERLPCCRRLSAQLRRSAAEPPLTSVPLPPGEPPSRASEPNPRPSQASQRPEPATRARNPSPQPEPATRARNPSPQPETATRDSQVHPTARSELFSRQWRQTTSSLAYAGSTPRRTDLKLQLLLQSRHSIPDPHPRAPFPAGDAFPPEPHLPRLRKTHKREAS